MSKLRVALLGTAHPHIGMFSYAFGRATDNSEIIGYADIGKKDGQDDIEKAKSTLGIEAETLKRYDDYHKLLAQKPDLAAITSDNKSCCEAALETLSMKIPTLLEKPLCENFDDALKIYECAKKNNTLLAVNWPIAHFPSFNKAKELCDNGEIGRIFRVVYRSPATWGPYSYGKTPDLPPNEFLKKTWWYNKEFGGGSLLDYACYGVALSTWFFGKKAESVSAITKNFTLSGFDVEDYSAFILDFEKGVGLCEGSWSTYNCGEVPTGPVIYGENGTIVCDRHSDDVKVYIGRSHNPVPPTKIIKCQPINAGKNLYEIMSGALLYGKELHPLLRDNFNLAVMAALDAGKKSAESGKSEKTAKY